MQTTITITDDGVQVLTDAGDYAAFGKPEPSYPQVVVLDGTDPYLPRITRDQQKQAYGLFAVAFGTTDQDARHEFTRAVVPNVLDPSWAALTTSQAAQVIRALEATVAVDTLLGERYASIRG